MTTTLENARMGTLRDKQLEIAAKEEAKVKAEKVAAEKKLKAEEEKAKEDEKLRHDAAVDNTIKKGEKKDEKISNE